MPNQLQKAINLVKKTGDRLIVFDNVKTDNPYVLMDLDEYEKLVIGRSEVRGLTEEELLDKINRDIAIWKSEENFPDIKEKQVDNFYVQAHDNISNIANFRQKNNKYIDNYIDRERFSDMQSIGEAIDKKNKKGKGLWNIPPTRKEAAEEIIEEDRQYLEDIDF